MTGADVVERFLRASVRGPLREAARLLADDPGIATHDFRTALVLGDVDRVRAALAAEPDLVTRADGRTGWTPLLGACNSRWHRDPVRARGLVEIAALLLAAGADPNTAVDNGDRHCDTLFAAAGCANNVAMTRLLLEHGAVPEDHTLYLAAFFADHECLRLLLPHMPDIAASTALAAPISIGDAEGVRLLLAAGVDPGTPLPADLVGGTETVWTSALAAAVEQGSAEIVALLLGHGADPNGCGGDGRSAYRTAVRRGRADLTALLAEAGAADDTTDGDRLLSACLTGDDETARRLANTPFAEDEQGDALVLAADRGAAATVALMLDIGFDVHAHGGGDGTTALHAAAGSGSAELVRLLLDRGADVDALDRTYQDTPLGWAVVGSGLRLGAAPHPDWPATVRILLDAGATMQAWGPGKPPSDDVAAVLAEHGIGPATA